MNHWIKTEMKAESLFIKNSLAFINLIIIHHDSVCYISIKFALVVRYTAYIPVL